MRPQPLFALLLKGCRLEKGCGDELDALLSRSGAMMRSKDISFKIRSFKAPHLSVSGVTTNRGVLPRYSKEYLLFQGLSNRKPMQLGAGCWRSSASRYRCP